MSHDPLLNWKSTPFLERPLATLALVSFLILLSVLLYQITVVLWQTPFYYAAGMILVISNLLPYFITTEYSFFDAEIIIKYSFVKITRKYTDFGCFYTDKKGVMLGTFKMPRRLDPFRGQSIRYSKDKSEKEALMQLLKEKIGKKY